MSLLDLMRKGSLRVVATATPATVATHGTGIAATVAEVATVAVANAPDIKAANDPMPDSDRWCWPPSDAMNTAEIEQFTARLTRFAGRGLALADAERLADKMVIRDREGDDRRVCLECAHLSGRRCGGWQHAGIGGPVVPAELVQRPQRCPAFRAPFQNAPCKATS